MFFKNKNQFYLETVLIIRLIIFQGSRKKKRMRVREREDQRERYLEKERDIEGERVRRIKIERKRLGVGKNPQIKIRKINKKKYVFFIGFFLTKCLLTSENLSSKALLIILL